MAEESVQINTYNEIANALEQYAKAGSSAWWKIA